MAHSLLSLLAAAGLGLAGAALVASAPLSAQTTAASASRDFECFVLLQDRRTGISANAQLDAAQRAQIVNNLTIISAFYAGILSRLPYGDVLAGLAQARRDISAANAEQRDAFAAQCTNRYLTTLNSLTATAQQAAQ